MGEKCSGSKKKSSGATQFFASYKDALASAGCPNAEKYSYGFGFGWREYTFIDVDNMKEINLAYKKETGYKVTSVNKLSTKPTASLAGFTLPEEKMQKGGKVNGRSDKNG